MCEGLPGGEEGGVAVGEEAVVVGKGLVVHFSPLRLRLVVAFVLLLTFRHCITRTFALGTLQVVVCVFLSPFGFCRSIACVRFQSCLLVDGGLAVDEGGDE